MANYNFKKFFENTPIHNNVYISNERFLIKKSELKKSQLDYVNTFPLTESYNNGINQLIEIESKKKTIKEFKPERLFRGVRNIIVMNQVAIDEGYYNFIQSVNCRVFITENNQKHSPLSIYNNNHEMVGVLLPIILDDYIGKSIEYNQYLEEIKLNQEYKQITKLMKPLFVNGMYNREGKRIRASYLKTISRNNNEYPLWVASGKPDKDYTQNERDKYYLYIQKGEWLVMSGYTEFELEQKAGYEHLNKEWYGNFEGRQKYFDENFYNGRSMEEAHKLIKLHVEKEELFIKELGNNGEIQAQLLKANIDKEINTYIEARDNKGKHASFIGALFLDELDKCEEIASVLRKERQEKEQQRKKEIAEQKAKENKEKEEAEKLLIEETENSLINGGTIKGGEIIIKLADKYNINIPLRTKGWIYDSLAECTITESGNISYRYWKRKKGSTGSQKVYDVLRDIITAINNNMVADITA